MANNEPEFSDKFMKDFREFMAEMREWMRDYQAPHRAQRGAIIFYACPCERWHDPPNLIIYRN